MLKVLGREGGEREKVCDDGGGPIGWDGMGRAWLLREKEGSKASLSDRDSFGG